MSGSAQLARILSPRTPGDKKNLILVYNYMLSPNVRSRYIISNIRVKDGPSNSAERIKKKKPSLATLTSREALSLSRAAAIMWATPLTAKYLFLSRASAGLEPAIWKKNL